MAYKASALSFILEVLDKQVIITGSQILLCRLRSDAKDNLITSMLIISQRIVNEVCLYFSGKLLRRNRTIKSSSDDLIAFASPNYHPLAETGINIVYNYGTLEKPKENKPFYLVKFKQTSIGILKVFPRI